MNIRHIKAMDALIGSIAVKVLSPPIRIDSRLDIRSLLIIRPGGIGDALLLASSVNALKKNFPQVHITFLAELRNAGVFNLIPDVDKVLRYDNPGEFFKTLQGRYDVVIDTEQWHRLSAVVARLVRAPIKIGFDTNERRRMFTHGIRYDQNAYEPDNFLALLEPLEINSKGNIGTASLLLPPQAVINASKLLQPLCSDVYVVIFPGGSIKEKRWGAERFSLVSKQLAENGYRIVVVGGREDREAGDMIAGAGGLNLAGMTTLAETAAVIARSCLVISGDSGVLHLAVGLDILTVSLFGPGNAAKWAPKGEKHIVLNHKLSCSPCTRFGTTPPCPNGVSCMVAITPDEVVAASLSQLKRGLTTLQT